MRWAESQRMAFISRFVSENGHINRSDIMKEFGISMPQASNDFKTYQELHPESLTYNTKKKRYERFLHSS